MLWALPIYLPNIVDVVVCPPALPVSVFVHVPFNAIKPPPPPPRVYTHHHSNQHVVIYHNFHHAWPATCEPWSNTVLDVSGDKIHGGRNESSLNSPAPLAFPCLGRNKLLAGFGLAWIFVPPVCSSRHTTVLLFCAVLTARHPSPARGLYIREPFSGPVII